MGLALIPGSQCQNGTESSENLPEDPNKSPHWWDRGHPAGFSALLYEGASPDAQQDVGTLEGMTQPKHKKPTFLEYLFCPRLVLSTLIAFPHLVLAMHLRDSTEEAARTSQKSPW